MNGDVARILGWDPEPLKRDCISCMAEVDFWDVPYTADDLVAWLQTHVEHDDWMFGWDGETFYAYAFWNTHKSGYEEEGGGWDIDVEDITILGALEQLVLKAGS